MNKEQQELLDEVYKNYFIKKSSEIGPYGVAPIISTKDEFIGRVTTNPDFAKQWGVTIYTAVEEGNIRIGINYNNKTIESYDIR